MSDISLLQLAEAVVQEPVHARQFAATTLLQSLFVSLNGKQTPWNSSNRFDSSLEHVQQLAFPKSDARSHIQLQHVIFSVRVKERRIAALEEKLLQLNTAANEQGNAIAAAKAVPKSNQPLSYKQCEQLAKFTKQAAAPKAGSNWTGHRCQLQATWSLQAAPTPQQQACAAANAARHLLQLQQRASRQLLQPVPFVGLSLHWCSEPSAKAKAVEEQYWQSVVVSSLDAGNQQSNGALRFHSSAVTAMVASPCTTKVALGNQLGTVTVLVFGASDKVVARFEGSAATSASNSSISGEAFSIELCCPALCKSLHILLHLLSLPCQHSLQQPE